MIGNVRLTALLAAASVCAMATSAYAQDAPEAGDARVAAASEPTGDIVVTARKTAEPLSKVPISVSAFTGEALEQAGIKTPLDLARDTPSLRVSQSLQASDSVQFTLRGQTAGEIQLTIDQPVGIYIDGVNYPRVYGLTAGFFDLERIEVLKGPQGTLYGRNTTGGAVNIVTKGADYDGTHGYIFGEFGNHASRRINGAINTVLVDDKLAFRFAFQNWQRNGYGKSRITGQDLGGDKNQTFLRGSLRWDPTSDLSVELKADWLRVREHGALMTARFYVPVSQTDQQVAIDLGLNPTLASSITAARNAIQNVVTLGNQDLLTSDVQDLSFNNLDHHSVGLTIKYDLSPDLTLKSITGYRYLNDDRQFDLDGTRYNILTYGIDSPGPNYYPHWDLTTDKLFTQELNLSGRLGSSFDFLLGGFYSYEKGDDGSTNNLRAGQVSQIVGSPYTINQTRAVNIISESWALFMQDNWHVTDTLTLTGGIRYSHERKGLTQQNGRFAPSLGNYTCTTNTSAVVTDLTQCAVTRFSSWNGVSWLASASWQVTPDVMVYAKVSKGFKAGGYDTRPIAPPFNPESAQDYELGLKGRFLNGRLRTNLAIYQTEYRNKQEQAIVPLEIIPGSGILVATSLTANAATATIRGIEADFNARLTDNFSIGGSLTYLHGRYGSYTTALNFAGATVDASGEAFADPRWSYSLNAKYVVPMSSGEMRFMADWAWTEGRHPSARQIDTALPAALVDELFRQDVGLLNVRLEYFHKPADLTIALYATNVLNKVYQVAGSTRLGTGGAQVGVTQEPRMFGISFRKGFGGE